MDKLLTVCVFISCLLSIGSCTDPISCGDLSSADCKVKFGKEFEGAFKELHLNAINELCDKLKSFANDFMKEHPNDDNINRKFREKIEKIEYILERLNANKDDEKKVAERIRQLMDDILGRDVRELSSELPNQLTLEPKLKEIFKPYFKLIRDTAKLYTDMYAGLRENDLKDFPDYEKLKDKMSELQSAEDNEHKMPIFATLKEYMGHEFNLPYLTAVQDVI